MIIKHIFDTFKHYSAIFPFVIVRLLNYHDTENIHTNSV